MMPLGKMPAQCWLQPLENLVGLYLIKSSIWFGVVGLWTWQDGNYDTFQEAGIS